MLNDIIFYRNKAFGRQVGVIRALLCCMEMSCKYSGPSRSAGYHLLALRELTAKVINAEQSHHGEQGKSFQDAIGTHSKLLSFGACADVPDVTPFSTWQSRYRGSRR